MLALAAAVPASAQTQPSAPVFSVSALTSSATRAHGHFGFSLAAGASGSAAIAISSGADVALTAQVYPADLVEGHNGALSPTEPDPTLNGPRLWVHPVDASIILPPHGRVTDSFTVTVPAGTPPGDHPAAIVVAADVGTQGTTVVQAREALIVEIHVPGTAHPSAQLGVLGQTPSGATAGPMTFGLSVTSTGDVTINVSGMVTITDDSGHQVGTIQLAPSAATLIPEGAFDLTSSVWTPPPSGRVHLQAEVRLDVEGGPSKTLRSNSLTFGSPPSPPWLLIVGVVVLLILGAGLGLIVWRRRRPIERDTGGAFHP